MSDAARRHVRDYATVTATYWAFTLTDGALRMLVLLHLHERGLQPLAIASLFLGYELSGVLTNGLGGWLGARTGLKATLLAGLALQVVALAMLGLAPPAALGVGLVLASQALSGIAKDLTKMSSKSYVKLVVPAGDRHGLLRLVALLTGSKNALKGVGFFAGGLLLGAVGFHGAMLAMAAGVAATLAAAAALLPNAPGRAPTAVALRSLLARAPAVQWLSAARLLLFGARDVWFVLGVPVFLSATLGWPHASVGAFLAAWVIGYGLVQAAAPRHVGAAGRGGARRSPPTARSLGGWTAALLLPLAGILAGLAAGLDPAATLVAGLALFGVVFATISAIHSYLIVHYAAAEHVSLEVGFYYMANAAGRFLGTLLSGWLFQAAGQGQAGLQACLVGSLLLAAGSAALCVPLVRAEARVAG